ncbi:cysteine--tRNA ligase [Longimicrobium sp.]|uniref:cysteine--tRNA ligase n=1 Tax=Longimicrobium sp. TaxID=2029185 RepID=UPI002E348D26|nr:cysteine--tRNA ligase [Longimicrobium sp.]HEX6038335.1 cysteine--tRNA ligase [Longimicrobium sp.]
MPLRFYNTLTRREEEFVPLHEGKVGMYTCGPTVYAPPHIGNLRTFFFSDLVRRYLEYRGYEVKFVMNLTDVDDKTIRGAVREGVSLNAYTEPFIESLFRDFEQLGIRQADVHPRATHYIDGMIDIIRRLEENKLAYVADGSVYYDISEFKAYGNLSKVDVSAGRRGERVAADEYDKDDVRDFVLWKAVKPEDEQVGAAWDTPWGRGRPGWHIECSAMSMQELGETFDIHAGGVDLIFPHHEDEIAQSEGCTGKTFVRYWLHGEFLLLEGDKMAKSTGNIFNLQDLVERGVKPSSIRYLFLTAHYRSKLNFTFAGLEAAAEAVRRVRDARDRLREHPTVRDPDPSDTPVLHPAADEALTAFAAAMDQDLNSSVALAALHELVSRVNARLHELEGRPISQAEQQAALRAFERIDGVFGFVGLSDRENVVDEDLAAWVEERIQARQAARKARDFGQADAIRDEIAARGVLVEDTPQGPRWKLSA